MSDTETDESQPKPSEYHEGKQAATKFQAAMRAITGVSKERIVELEKQKPDRKAK